MVKVCGVVLLIVGTIGLSLTILFLTQYKKENVSNTYVPTGSKLTIKPFIVQASTQLFSLPQVSKRTAPKFEVLEEKQNDGTVLTIHNTSVKTLCFILEAKDIRSEENGCVVDEKDTSCGDDQGELASFIKPIFSQSNLKLLPDKTGSVTASYLILKNFDQTVLSDTFSYVVVVEGKECT